MEFKPDFEDIIPRMEAFWKGEVADAACVAAIARKGPGREVPAPATIDQTWLDIDYILDAAEARMEATHYAGVAVPVFRPNLGPDLFAALMGGSIEFREDTSWVKPFMTSWDDPPSFELDTECAEWKWHESIYARAVERAKGRYLVGAPDCHSGGDALVAMRGGTELCMDLYDVPDGIKAAMVKLTDGVKKFHAAWWPLIEAGGQRGHACSWMQTWSPGRSNAIQLDLLALISPDMFTEFFRDELVAQTGVLDNCVFHLDGPDAIKHVPTLAEVEGLTHIQWVYGAGNGPMTKWLDLLKDIQSRGVGLHLSCDPDGVETLLRELSSKGLYIVTWADSPEEADDIAALAGKLTHD